MRTPEGRELQTKFCGHIATGLYNHVCALQAGKLGSKESDSGQNVCAARNPLSPHVPRKTPPLTRKAAKFDASRREEAWCVCV